MFFITGATGFIGAALVAKLSQKGHGVLACDARAPSEAVARVGGAR